MTSAFTLKEHMIQLKRQRCAFIIMMNYANLGKPRVKVWARFPKCIKREMPTSI